MTSPGLMFLAAILTNNILLVRFLGMCPFLAISRSMKSALGMGAAVIFVMTCTTILNYLLYHGVLVPLGIDHLQFIVFILTIAGFVQFVEIVIERVSPVLYHKLGVFLPLITVNCAILGASLFMVINKYDFLRATAFGVGSGIGWSLVIAAMAGVRERLASSDVPKPLRGLGISLIITGLMAMAFMGFKNVVSIH